VSYLILYVPVLLRYQSMSYKHTSSTSLSDVSYKRTISTALSECDLSDNLYTSSTELLEYEL